MDHRIKVIHTHPFGVLGTLHVGWMEFAFRLQATFDVAGDRPDLGGGITLADDKIICRGIIEVPKVQQYNIFAFDVRDTIDDQFLKAVGNGFSPEGFFSAYQIVFGLVQKTVSNGWTSHMVQKYDYCP